MTMHCTPRLTQGAGSACARTHARALSTLVLILLAPFHYETWHAQTVRLSNHNRASPAETGSRATMQQVDLPDCCSGTPASPSIHPSEQNIRSHQACSYSLNHLLIRDEHLDVLRHTHQRQHARENLPVWWVRQVRGHTKRRSRCLRYFVTVAT